MRLGNEIWFCLERKKMALENKWVVFVIFEEKIIVDFEVMN